MPVPWTGYPSGRPSLLYLLRPGYRKGCPLNSPESQSQHVGDNGLYSPDDGHLHATVEPGPAGHERFSCTHPKVRKQADDGCSDDSRVTLQDEEGIHRVKRPPAVGKHTGMPDGPGIGE